MEIVDVGPTSHATGMLVGHVPSRRLLFQSDLLRVNEPGSAVTRTQAAADLASAIGRLGLDVETIAGVRGRVGTADDLRAASRD